MKICITTTGQGMDAEIDPRFYRCRYFTIGDPDTMQFESIENVDMTGPAEGRTLLAQFVADEGVEVVLTGHGGPNVYNTLCAAGIDVIAGVCGKVGKAVEDYNSGRLQPYVSQPSISDTDFDFTPILFSNCC